MKKFKRIIQLELNEISKPIIDKLIAENKLPAFKKISQTWQYQETSSEQEYQHIEPWIQWVSAHTGKTFAEHQIFHLGDAANLTHPQVWELLSSQHKQSAIIGSMNTTRGKTKGGIYFPDPWAKDGQAYPDALQPLWTLISKKVQTHATSKLSLKDLWQGFLASIKFNLPYSLYFKIAAQLVRQKIDKKQSWKMAAIFDLMLAEMFKTILKKTDYSFYTLFLNANAHYQHHFWRQFEPELFNNEIHSPDCHKSDNPILYGYKIYDKILRDIIKIAESDPDTLIIIASAFSQKPYTEKESEGGFNYYRLTNHQDFINKLFPNNNYQVYPLMSRDWQLDHSDPNNLLEAKTILSNLKIADKNLFSVKQDSKDSLFIETAITQGNIDSLPILNSENKSIGLFKEYFTKTAVKSGHHDTSGSLWLSQPILTEDTPQVMPLTAIAQIPLSDGE